MIKTILSAAFSRIASPTGESGCAVVIGVAVAVLVGGYFAVKGIAAA